MQQDCKNDERLYKFDEDMYGMLMSILGNSYGNAWKVDICGTIFIITETHSDGCRIAEMVKNL